MSELLETLRQEGVDPALLSAVEEYRAAHPLDAALRPRIPAPAWVTGRFCARRPRTRTA